MGRDAKTAKTGRVGRTSMTPGAQLLLGLIIIGLLAYGVLLGISSSVVPGLIIGLVMVGVGLGVKASEEASRYRWMLIAAGGLVLAAALVRLAF